MSKREGEYVTLDELVDEVGVDAARFFLLARSHDTTVDLDLDLAVRESAENPVYYVQYAHARIASILGSRRRRARRGGDRVARAGRGSAPVRAGAAAPACSPSTASWPTPSSAARPIASPPTRWSWRRISPPSIATAMCSACSRGRPSRCGSHSRWRRDARSRARSTCSASARPSRCDQRGSKRASSASSRALSAALSPSAPAASAPAPAASAVAARRLRRQRGSSSATIASAASTAATGTR